MEHGQGGTGIADGSSPGLRSGDVSEGKLKVFVYGGRAILSVPEFERDCRINEKLGTIEKRLEQLRVKS
jgi:hypothetical protein